VSTEPGATLKTRQIPSPEQEVAEREAALHEAGHY
jgi:hypothetical protein